jgi:protein-tyrosine phosphatase
MTSSAPDVDDRREPPRVLVVCTANLCRSPLVEALLRTALAEDGIRAEVASAGVGAPLAAQPDRRLLRVADELGLDLGAHRSTPVTRDSLRWADLILTMTGEQCEHVRALDRSSMGRTVPLRAAAWRAQVIGGRPRAFAEWVARLAGESTGGDGFRSDPAHDVADPTGGPLREYREMAEEVHGLVRTLVERWSGR